MTQNTKISNIPWIGEIPEDWKIQRLKSVILRSKNGAWGDDPKGDSNDIACIRVADFDSENFGIDDSNLTYRNIPDCEDILLNEGDLLLEKSGGGDLQLVGRVINYNKPFRAVTSNFLATIKIKKSSIENKFLYYLLRYFYSVNINYRSIKQTTGIQNLDSDSYFQEPIPLPPLHIQTIIANFLDQKTEQISTLISNKKKLINLLKEQKQSIIHQAVTKGIDSSAKMKDSGIPWIGEIPEDWRIRKLKYCVQLNKWKSVDNIEKKVALENIEGGTGRYIDTNGDFQGDGSFVRPDDVLFGKLRPYLAKVLLADFSGICVNEILVFTPNQNIIYPNFLSLLCLSSEFIKTVDSSTYGSKMPRAEWGFIGNMQIGFPSLVQQKAIVEFIKQEANQIDTTIEKIEKEITLIEEYRTSLIYQAVTGKISIS